MSISKFNIIRNNIIHCIFCNKDFKSLGFSTHVLVKHNMHSKEYYDRYLITKDENICNYCKNPTKFINCTYGYRRYCSNICARKSEETRQSMSDTWKSHDEEWKHNILNKCSETYYNKTGYKHNWSNPECRQKCINTYYDKTGYYHNMKNPKHIKARQELYLQKTGYKHNWANPELRKQSADKLYEKTGYKHYMQNPSTQIHSMHGFYVNDIWFDSKWEYELYYALNKSSNQFIYHPAIVFTYIKIRLNILIILIF